MLIRMAEPAFLGPGLDSGCVPPGSDSVFAGVELVCVLGVAVSASFFGVAGLELVGPPVNSDWAWAPAVLVLGVLGSEPVCALAGKASIPTRKATNTGLRKCLGEAGTHMS
jgi:hypothetical protein